MQPRRPLVHLTDLGLADAGVSPTIPVFADERARLGLGLATPAELADTVRMHFLPAMTLHVKESDVHLH